MEQKNIYRIASALLILFFAAACSAPPVAPTLQQPPMTDTQAPQASATAPLTELPGTAESTSMPVPEAGLCTNTYYPVRQGATWIYKSTGGPAGEYRFTDTISAVGPDSFTLTTEIAGLTNRQDWNCTPEGLVAHQLGGAPAAMLNSQGIVLTLNATNASGVVFPTQINAGDQWQHILDVAGNVSVANEEAEATGTAQMNFTALGNESVTVPAGTFDAMKIQIDTTLNVEASYEGITLPVTFTGSHTYWFAPGVGWVKATGTGNFLAASFSETTELQSYNIP
jgi:hypothetical protein